MTTEDIQDRMRANERETLELRGWVQRISGEVAAGRFTTQHKLTIAGLVLTALAVLGGAGISYFASSADVARLGDRVQRNADELVDLNGELRDTSAAQRRYQEQTQRSLHRIDRNLVRIADKLRVRDVEEPPE